VVPPNFYSTVVRGTSAGLTSTLFRLFLAQGRWDNVYLSLPTPNLSPPSLASQNKWEETESMLTAQSLMQRYYYPHKGTPRRIIEEGNFDGHDGLWANDDELNRARANLGKAVDGERNFSTLETVSCLHEIGVPYEEISSDFDEDDEDNYDEVVVTESSEEISPLPPFVHHAFLSHRQPRRSRFEEQPIHRDESNNSSSGGGFFSALFGSDEIDSGESLIPPSRHTPPPSPSPNPCLSTLGTALKSHEGLQTFSGATHGLGGPLAIDVGLYSAGSHVRSSHENKNEERSDVAEDLSFFIAPSP